MFKLLTTNSNTELMAKYLRNKANFNVKLNSPAVKTLLTQPVKFLKRIVSQNLSFLPPNQMEPRFY